MALPTGTVTFLFTDVEGSTRLWDAHRAAMGTALARHDAIVREAIASAGGHVFATGGDGFCAVFASAANAVVAALSAQRELSAEPWPEDVALRVRMGVHTGEVQERDGNYFGPAVNQAARLMGAGHGGQVVVSALTADLLDVGAVGVELVDLGQVVLKGFVDPVHVFGVSAPGVPWIDRALVASPLLGAGQSRRSTPPTLPVPLGPTIGRGSDVDAIARTLRSGVRLFTITGTGGVGKTRLALEVARAVEVDFDEVRVVRVGDVVDPALVTATIAATIGVPVEQAQPALDAVAGAIDRDHLLLVLDNLEQVVDAGPELATLLDRCPGTSLLITSRHVMRLHGEHEYPLATLDLPAADPVEGTDTVERIAAGPAVALFVDQATSVRPEFRLDASNAGAVAEICRRLDGLPLAIELVAAHLRLLPPDRLLARLGDRIDLLTSGSADLPDRQRTLRATLDWSYRLLDPAEQALFAQLAVFAGGASLDAVEEICGAESVGHVLETLSALIEKSLVVTEDDPVGGPRIGMLQTVRAYAWERLEDRPEFAGLRDRHAAWFLELVRSCDPSHQAGAAARWVELDRDLPNVRAAIAWRTEQDDDEALGLFAASLCVWYWLAGRMSEGRMWIESLAPRLDPARGVLDDTVVACLSEALGAVRFSLGAHAEAEVLLRRALDTYEAAADLEGVTLMSCLLAMIVPIHGAADETLALATAGVAGARSLELDWGLAFALAILGSAIRRYESDERGLALQLEALETAREVGEPFLLGNILCRIAFGSVSNGNAAAAVDFLAEAADCCRRTRQMEGTVFCLEVGALHAFADGRARDAAVLVGAAEATRERVEIAVWPVMKDQRDQLVAALAAALGTDESAAALDEGRAADPFALLPG